jgi:hypothetical protein
MNQLLFKDMLEAVRLVRTEELSISKAALHINNVKLNEVPRMTLSNRLGKSEPANKPDMGRPTELSKGAEEGLVVCLELPDDQAPTAGPRAGLLCREQCFDKVDG